MNHAVPAARPWHTALACILLFGGTLGAQLAVSRMPPDPWAGLARSSDRARAAVEAVRPCERALERAHGGRQAGLADAGDAQTACAAALATVDAAGLPDACRSAAAEAVQAATVMARGEDGGREAARYRAARARCLAEAAG